jgi:hypothetical protein
LSRHAKQKGSRYEREFCERVQAYGLPAERVPLSGAMAGYPDDVVVCDSVRVECKYRKSGSGFARLHTWHAGDGTRLHLIDAGLMIYTLGDWCERVHCRQHGGEPFDLRTEEKSTRAAMLLTWIGDADALALRRPRSPWLVAERTEAL